MSGSGVVRFCYFVVLLAGSGFGFSMACSSGGVVGLIRRHTCLQSSANQELLKRLVQTLLRRQIIPSSYGSAAVVPSRISRADFWIIPVIFFRTTVHAACFSLACSSSCPFIVYFYPLKWHLELLLLHIEFLPLEWCFSFWLFSSDFSH